MKVFNIVWCVLFVLFAALQYNDPDPYVWVPIYLYTAVLCWKASQGKFFPKWEIAGMLVYVAYAIYLFIDKNGVESWATEHHAENIAQSMHAEKPWIEETREFMGLLILLIVNGVHLLQASARKKAAG